MPQTKVTANLLTLFLLRRKAQKKKLCKKKMPYSPTRRALLRAGRSLLKKRRKTIAQSKFQLPAKSQFVGEDIILPLYVFCFLIPKILRISTERTVGVL